MGYDNAATLWGWYDRVRQLRRGLERGAKKSAGTTDCSSCLVTRIGRVSRGSSHSLYSKGATGELVCDKKGQLYPQVPPSWTKEWHRTRVWRYLAWDHNPGETPSASAADASVKSTTTWLLQEAQCMLNNLLRRQLVHVDCLNDPHFLRRGAVIGKWSRVVLADVFRITRVDPVADTAMIRPTVARMFMAVLLNPSCE